MPSILRIFPYQILASLSVLGHSGSYDQGGGGGERDLQYYAVRALVGESAYRIMHSQGCHDQHYGQCDGLCERMLHCD